VDIQEMPTGKDSVESAAWAAQKYAFEVMQSVELDFLYQAEMTAAAKVEAWELRQYADAFGSSKESLAQMIVLCTDCACRPPLPWPRTLAASVLLDCSSS